MNSNNLRKQQIERYRQMSGEERLMIGLRLHELACEVARESIRAAFPEANDEMVEKKLRQRLRLAYSRGANGMAR